MTDPTPPRPADAAATDEAAFETWNNSPAAAQRPGLQSGPINEKWVRYGRAAFLAGRQSPASPEAPEGPIAGAIREALMYHGIRHEFREEAIKRATETINGLTSPSPDREALREGETTRRVVETAVYGWATDDMDLSLNSDDLEKLIERLVVALALLPLPPVPSEEQVEGNNGWVLVPREPTEAMIQAGLNALGEWRKTLSADEALLRRSAPIENGRVFLASATTAEKADIRWRAMMAAAPNPPTGEDA